MSAAPGRPKQARTAAREGEGTPIPPRQHQQGAAILLAMLTVTLVATVAAAALWQQWRSLEVETAERTRVQSGWVLTGALDWSRLVLREDSRTSSSSSADHLAEPWAVPLEEARLSTFLAADRNNQANVDELGEDAFLSGQITDLQSRLNVSNLIKEGAVAEAPLKRFAKLFELLNLPSSELVRLSENLRFASDFSAENKSGELAPLRPQRVEELVWLGLSPQSLAVLAPHITLLPAASPINVNTASAEVLCATIATLDLAAAKQLVALRERSHFRSVAEVSAADSRFTPDPAVWGVTSKYFEVRGQLRIGQVTVNERSLVERVGQPVGSTKVHWRERLPTHSLQ